MLVTLKEKKARDISGWVYEILPCVVAGKNLKCSILHMFNNIKSEKVCPEFLKVADCATIYKGKGKKKEM